MGNPAGSKIGARVGTIGEQAIDRPKRPCSKCRKPFQPTRKRRLLCAWCFVNASEEPHEYPVLASAGR